VPALTCARLPFGAIRPGGWLALELGRAAAGLTGRLMDLWPDVGAESAWLGGDGEDWERGPYYARGLTALAHVLDDAELLRRARPWIEHGLASQREDGMFGPRSNDDWWPRMPMVDALLFHHEATGDPRVVGFLDRYLRHLAVTIASRPLEGWGRARGGESMGHALWLHARTGDSFLLELVDRLRAQTTDWMAELAAEVPGDAFEVAHGVNRAMGLKLPVVLARRTGDRGLADLVRTGWERTLADHGQVQGVFSCDEMLHGTSPAQGSELCTVVELLQTLLAAFELRAEAWCADAIERLAYNALPAMIAPDGCTRQYFALANQVACTPGAHRFWYHHDTDLLFGVATGFGCCTANMHLGWPTVVRSLWLASSDGGVVAPLFGPCTVTVPRPDGARLVLAEDTAYPFDDRVRIAVGLDRPHAFAMWLRIPGWASRVTVAVNGEVAWEGAGGTLAAVHRTWRDGDVVEMALPSEVRTTAWDGGVAVERGALVHALAVGEAWRAVGGTPPFADYELHPTTPWSYALLADEISRAGVETHPPGALPWSAAGAPIRLRVRGRRVENWGLELGSAAPPPAAARSTSPPEDLVLLPFGSARLRIAVFPRIA
jgi:hypothetical protein